MKAAANIRCGRSLSRKKVGRRAALSADATAWFPAHTTARLREPARLRFAGGALSKSMSEHTVNLRWQRGEAPFEYQKYPRDHTWKFDGGHEMEATAAPAYLGNPKNVDPEEAFVASLSSCHMLTFLAVACKKKFVLDEYLDDAVGHMEKNENGKLAITRVELHPKLKFSGEKQPTEQELDEMHHFAHTECFIANSVKTKVTVEK